MKDPRLEGAHIMRETACRHGTHVFVWDGLSYYGPVRNPPDNTDCSCGAYSWKAWQAAQAGVTP